MAAISFRSDDVDEAATLAQTVFYDSQILPVGHPRPPAGFRMKVDTAGPLTFGVFGFEHEIITSVGGLDVTYSVGVPLSGTFSFQFGQGSFIANEFTATVVSPTSDLTYRGFGTGTEQMFLFAFGKEQFENHLRNLLGRDRVDTFDLAPSLDIRNGLGAQWWRLASTLALELNAPSGLATNPLITAQLSSAVMTGLLLATDHPYRDDLDAWTRPGPPAAIRRASEIIESRAHEPLTIPQIAAEIGCSVTALQAGYRKHLDMTPREHLGRVRMDRAHTMLQSAHPGSTTVAEIAAMCGFYHYGRFAAEYRKIYGVSPRVTLRNR